MVKGKIKSATTRGRAPKKPAAQAKTSPEYQEYLERYNLLDEERPRLSSAEYDKLDDELLDLLALESDRGPLSDEQVVRLRELEYLLIENES